ncbi:MAG: ABC transporter ATP-binding protein [Butyrivibrio sp.]|uniref:ABC transporter ATP-binding protein n=1 Tax=Butyrivibrio sp. TaxID=28121 RepID=UPI001B01FF3F|nr:ABC transporter ATP-binding protein [Butyrivibrio sp.]MBO6240273.1 ABC transporter ATP-binding protein [Butyrivibrio sp.]
MDIRIENLTKTYGNLNAVDHMNLSINDGELVGLLGPSGCGKSTTLFMLSGLTTPTEGKIYFGDKDVTSIPPEDREIGLVFQNYALYPHMTVEDNITFPLINRGMKKAQAREEAFEIAKVVKIEQYMKRRPSELSGGQQQRVAIARALVKKPQVLLLDEPLSNLDAKLRVATREEIRRIQQEVKITTIFVTHDQEEAMSISDRIAVMKEGVLQQYEVPQTMYLNPANTFVANFLGMPEINNIEIDVKGGVISADGNILRKGASLADGHYKAGIRPESFYVDENGAALEVSNIRMTGRDLLLFTKLGSTDVRVLVHSYMQIGVGDKLGVSVRDEHILVFDDKEVLIGRF